MSVSGPNSGDPSLPIVPDGDVSPQKGVAEEKSPEKNVSTPEEVAALMIRSVEMGDPLNSSKETLPAVDPSVRKEQAATEVELDKVAASLEGKGIVGNKSLARQLAEKIQEVAADTFSHSPKTFSRSASERSHDAVVIKQEFKGEGAQDAIKFQVMRTKSGRVYVNFPKTSIGEGGYNKVSYGVDVQTGQALAIRKTFDSSEETRHLGRREVELIREVHSDGEKNGVIGVMDVADLSSGKQVVVMKFMSGGDLSKCNLEDFNPKELFQVADDIAEGLSHIHAKGIIHSDLKSENVLLNGEGRAKITDFGLSRKGAEEIEKAKSYHIWAPELFAGDPTSSASDVFAFGLMIYDLFLEGYVEEVPLWQAQICAVINDHEEHPESVEEKRAYEDLMSGKDPILNCEEDMGFPFPDIEKDGDPLPSIDDLVKEKSFRGLICRCCRRNPSDRPSMEEVRRDLDELQGEYNTLHAKEPGTPPLHVLMNLFGKNIVD